MAAEPLCRGATDGGDPIVACASRYSGSVGDAVCGPVERRLKNLQKVAAEPLCRCATDGADPIVACASTCSGSVDYAVCGATPAN